MLSLTMMVFTTVLVMISVLQILLLLRMSIGIIAVLEFRLLAFPFHYDVVGCRYGGLCFIFIILCFFF
jgi:hypothetical protein